MIKKKDLEGMREGQLINGYVVIQNIEERLTKNGSNTYLTGNLQCLGAVPYKVWSSSMCFNELRGNTSRYMNIVCEISGRVNIYEGSTSIVIDSCRLPYDGDDVPDIMDFFESKYDAEHFWGILYGLLQKNCSENALKVFDLVMKDYKDSFMTEFAAVSHHDNCKSGLIGHTTKVTKLVSVLNMYPDLVKRCGGKDVLYIGCAIHDIGKVMEYSNGAVSPEGLRVSHMIMGAMMVSQYKDEICNLMGEEFFYSLVSIISGHAGEYGERPRTVAAYAVHLLDNLESCLTSLDVLCNTPQQIFYNGFKLN